ncbi:MAG TPA: hypothetical protein VHQ65_02195, partial [Thermoanaerobaculia bacterium]|nr:hypothetical protein [Thermoanaerobaculia bacterium]
MTAQSCNLRVMTGPGILHAALAPGDAASLRPFPEALRTDRDRLAAVLQAAALVAHLEHAGAHLPDGWSGARMGGDGVLRVPEVRPGPLRRLPQQLLLEFVARCFRTRG